MRRLLIILLSLSFTLVGCSTNPVTGEKNFILPNLDENWERQVGQQMYAPMRQSQGGDYMLDPALTDYVEDVGERLAAQASRQFAYEFHVLNDSTPNAWALPGGKIVVNRGLLTELNSEAELAAVLGHEIVHADAAHGARQQSKGTLTQIGMMAAMIYGSSKADSEMGQQIAMIVPQLGAQLITTKYGRDAERESDLYGMRYMSAAGYNPLGAVELQETFVQLSKDRKSDWLSGMFASHPPSKERVANNKATAKSLPDSGEFGRDVYLQKTAYLRKVKPAYEAYDKGRKALSEDKTAQARTLADQAIRIEPKEAMFYSLSGDIYAGNDNFRKAENAYNRAVQLDDDFFYHYLRRGQSRYERRKFDTARVDLEHSLELLPTAQANYLLGNLDKSEGKLQSAIKHYQAAAESGSEVSKQAQQELVLLELPSNPGKYIESKAALAEGNYVQAAVRNNSPVTVNGIRVKVEYINSNGQLREFSMNFRKTLGPGEWTALPTKIRDIVDANELARRVRVTVTGAKIVKDKKNLRS
ncbi:MAG: M48 family metalloprotease [Gammaproteobacteria bacterium]|nr:M48 family metalloprotease [Gammaproteobacteria bacterium]